MDEYASSVAGTNRRPQTAGSVHIFFYILLAGILAGSLVIRFHRPLILLDTVEIEPTCVQQVEQQIDPNTAKWAELARLPEIGETLAKGIIAYRDRQRVAANTGDDSFVVFSCLEDLIAVRGIGPKRLARIGPGLKFPHTESRPTR